MGTHPAIEKLAEEPEKIFKDLNTDPEIGFDKRRIPGVVVEKL